MKASKKSPLGEDKSGNGGRWMLTYSDMITLLLALFIVLYSMSSINAKISAGFRKYAFCI